MRLKKVQTELIDQGIKFSYKERNSLGVIYIGDKIFYEHYVNYKKTRVNIMVEEINLIDETQVIEWIRRNEDRLR